MFRTILNVVPTGLLVIAVVTVTCGGVVLAAAPFDGLKAGGRFRILHALSELDGPGQWWRDEADGLLLAWPRRADPDLDVAVADDLVEVEGASHLRIEGIAFEESRGDLVTVKGGADVVVDGGHFAWSGRDGIVFTGSLNGGATCIEHGMTTASKHRIMASVLRARARRSRCAAK